MLKNSIFTHKRIKLNPYLMPHTTVYTIWIKDLNLTPETIKPLEENRRENLQNIDLDNDFLDLITKARHLKQKCVPSGSAVKKSICNAGD